MGSHNPGALTTGAINATTAWARTKQHNARPKALQTLTCRVNLHLRHNQRPDRRASAPESETLGQERPSSPAGLPPHKRHRTNHSDECAATGSSGIRLVPRGRSPLPRKRQPPYKTPEPVLADGSIPKPPRWHQYAYGATNILPERWARRPRALLLFGGTPREGDIACWLSAVGWVVVVVDMAGPVE